VRILIHDYAGHPFQLELSQELARCGHEILHIHFDGLPTPKAGFDQSPADNRLTVRGIRISSAFDKGKLVTRYMKEREYGRAVACEITSFKPDAVLSANTPLAIQGMLMRATRNVSGRFYFWMQDFYSLALQRFLPKRLPVLGGLIGRYYEAVERTQLRRSDGTIFITADFLNIASEWGLKAQNCHVIENWAPLDAIQPRDLRNPWAQQHGLAGKRVLLYSGTLGMKHDPMLLWELAERTRHMTDVMIAVVSSGPGAEFLASRLKNTPLPNLLLVGTQPFAALADILGSASILIGILERSAGIFSVPSKVLSYLCAGRPLLLAIPSENLAARIVQQTATGFIVDPENREGFINAALDLLRDGELRNSMSVRARAYAESAFDVKAIAVQFERVLAGYPAIWHTHQQKTVLNEFVARRAAEKTGPLAAVNGSS
jgi:colanic acid biosynthesis glycosyl transferase WcaI